MSRNTTIDQILQRIVKTGKFTNDEIQSLLREAEANDFEQLVAINEAFKKIGADKIGSGELLNAADYYIEGAEKFKLNYDLQLPIQLPIPFDDLDRKTQFFVLFQEWSRRELDGMMALNSGKTELAVSIFEECAERAKQLDVDELLARSYEGLMRCAQKRNIRHEERKWLRAAHGLRTKGRGAGAG